MTPSVDVLCSDPDHPSWPRLDRWCAMNGAQLHFTKGSLAGGDLLLLVSCTEIIGSELRSRYRKALVIHEAALPHGRGWSPMAWQIIGGANEITVSLIEAADSVDSGPIYRQETVFLQGHELADEIGERRDDARLRLASWAVANALHAKPEPQRGPSMIYRRRTPEDSRIFPERTLAEQFNLLRVCEPRFPAFFDHRGHRYEITLRKAA